MARRVGSPSLIETLPPLPSYTVVKLARMVALAAQPHVTLTQMVNLMRPRFADVPLVTLTSYVQGFLASFQALALRNEVETCIESGSGWWGMNAPERQCTRPHWAHNVKLMVFSAMIYDGELPQFSQPPFSAMFLSSLFN